MITCSKMWHDVIFPCWLIYGPHVTKTYRLGENKGISFLVQAIIKNGWFILLCDMLWCICYSPGTNITLRPVMIDGGYIATSTTLGPFPDTHKRGFMVSLACRDHLAQSGDFPRCRTIELNLPRRICEIRTREDWDSLVKVTKTSGAQVNTIFAKYKQLTGGILPDTFKVTNRIKMFLTRRIQWNRYGAYFHYDHRHSTIFGIRSSIEISYLYTVL